MARILIVDDSTFTRRKLKSILLQAGHFIVSEAANGLQACKEYEKHLPDLVTMDVTMPVMDGISAIKKIVEIFPEAKIVIISGHEEKRLILDALEYGAKNYVFKPIIDARVLGVIDRVLVNTASGQAN